MTNKTRTLILAICTLIEIAGVAVSELVHPWIGIAMTIGATFIVAWMLGQRYTPASDEELERMKQRLREKNEMYARRQDRERGDDS